MLSRHSFIQKKQKNELCNCSLIQPSALYSEQESFSIPNQREISQFENPLRHSRRFNPKYSFERQKTSLRGSRIGKEKENHKESIPAEANNMHSPMLQPSLMCASKPFQQDSEQRQRRKAMATTCKTSIFFKRTTLPVDGRYGKEEQQQENTKTNKQGDRNVLSSQGQTYRIHPSVETLKLSQISNETQYDYLHLHKNQQTQDQLSHQKLTQYHSQHAEVASQGGLTQYSQQSPLVRHKRRATKIFHRIEQLKFKSTESIDDSDSIEVSEVISDIVDSQFWDNLSEQRLPQNKRLTYLLKTRFSRMGDRQQ